jgi:hypothetical protein
MNRRDVLEQMLGNSEFEKIKAFDFDDKDEFEMDYRNDTGRYQDILEILQDLLIPCVGECKLSEGEILRMLSKLVYEGENNAFQNLQWGSYTHYVESIVAWANDQELPLLAKDFIEWLATENMTVKEAKYGFNKFIGYTWEKCEHDGINVLIDYVVRNTAEQLIDAVLSEFECDE